MTGWEGRIIRMLTTDPKFCCPVCGFQPANEVSMPITHCACGRICIRTVELWECADAHQAAVLLKYKYEGAHCDIVERCPVCKGSGKLWFSYTEITRIDGAKTTIRKVNHWTLEPTEQQRHQRHEDPFFFLKPCFRCLGDGEVPKIDGIDNKELQDV